MNQPVVGSLTPWGIVQGVTVIADGIVLVDTPSHGGFWLSEQRLEEMSISSRAYAATWSNGFGDQWWEEDIAACYVIAQFDVFSDAQREESRKCLERWCKK